MCLGRLECYNTNVCKTGNQKFVSMYASIYATKKVYLLTDDSCEQ